MTDQHIDSVPAGFERLPTGFGFIDVLQPCYRSIGDESVVVGMLVEKQHGNIMGICHGGVLVTLADVAAAHGIHVARGKRAPSPTINLSVDFISAARIGQWIQAEVHSASVKRRFGFCSGLITNSEGVVARFNGTFYLPEHHGMIKPEAIGEGIPGFFAE